MEFTKNNGIIIIEKDPFYRSFLYSIFHSLEIIEIYTYNTIEEIEYEKIGGVEQNLMIISLSNNKSNYKSIIQNIKKIAPNIKIVFISSKYDVDFAIETINAGAFDYVEKNQDVKNRIVRILNRMNFCIL